MSVPRRDRHHQAQGGHWHANAPATTVRLATCRSFGAVTPLRDAPDLGKGRGRGNFSEALVSLSHGFQANLDFRILLGQAGALQEMRRDGTIRPVGGKRGKGAKWELCKPAEKDSN